MRACLLGILAGCLSVHAQLDVEWVTVGNAGNPPDKTGFGAVAYEFQIMKHEVTCGQYAAFLNAVAATDPLGLYISNMDGTPMPKGQDDIRTLQGCLMRTGEKGSYHYKGIRDPSVEIITIRRCRCGWRVPEFSEAWSTVRLTSWGMRQWRTCAAFTIYMQRCCISSEFNTTRSV